MTITEKYFPILKKEITGWMVEEKMRWFEKIYTEHQPKVAVELGIWYGLSAIAQGIIIRELGLDCKLYAVDAYSKEAAIEGSNSEENTEWWLGLDFEEAKQSFINSIKKHGLENIIIPIFSRSDEAVNKMPNIDLCHFDSNHASEVITKELELYAPKMNAGAYAVFDDYFWVESYDTYLRGARKHKLNKHVVFEIDGQGFAIYRKKGAPTLADLKPISIRLEGERWDKRMAEANKYFVSQGINEILWVNGIHAEVSGIKASRPYVRDPQNIDTGETVKQKTVGSYLSHYMIYNIALSHPEWEYILILEDDCRFVEGWQDKLNQALKDVPQDFDWIFVGSCCTEGREMIHVKGDVYKGFGLCGHCSIVSRRALKYIIETSIHCDFPMDVSLYDFTFPNLQVYTILPRLAVQENTPLPL